jgi:hypothetical protein
MLGDGKGNFFPDRTQLNIGGDNKSIAQLNGVSGSTIILVGTNSDSLKAFHLNRKQRQIPILPSEVYAIITERNGKHYKQEFYYGDTYLSQSSRNLLIPPTVMKVIIYNNVGSKREMNF